MQALNKLITKLLRETADKIDSGNCELTESEAMDIMSVLAHRAMSMEQACRYLNLRNSRFRQLVSEGKLPKGRKVLGRSGLTWYQDELDEYIKRKTR